MKKTLFLMLSLFIAITISAFTYTVTVPEGTNECYIIGAMSGWNTWLKMDKIAENKYQLDIPAATTAHEYKYCSGPAWTYEDTRSGNRKYSDNSGNDVVTSWKSIYNPTILPGDITITANVPENTPDGEVYIAGSFQGWSPDNAQKLTKVSATQYNITINDVTDISYKLLCGTSWDYEEVTSGGGAFDRAASVKSPNVNVTVEKWKSIPGGELKGDGWVYLINQFPFAPLEGTRRIWVYLPPDYETNTEKRYPVLYMHDGQNVFAQGTYGSWEAHKALNQLHQDGKPVGIVVAINNGAGRMSEYTPFPNTPNAPVANGDKYLQAIIDNIMPYINENYRTLTDRNNTGIAGSSLGGLISYYAALKHENVFGRIGAISPSFWYCKNDLDTYVGNWTGQHSDDTKMYFICGDSESASMVSDMQVFYNSTSGKGFKEENMKYEVVAGGGHNEASWAAQIGRVYEFLFKDIMSNIETDEFENEQIKVSSNKNSINIASTNDLSLNFYLYDLVGKQMISKSVKGNASIHDVKSGTYIYKIQSEKGVHSEKIIVP